MSIELTLFPAAQEILDNPTQTKAGGGVGDGAGTRGGVTWSHDIDHQIAYITVACKRPAK